MSTLFQLITSVLFAPFHLSQIVSDRKLKNTMLFMQYLYLPIGMLIAGMIVALWIIAKFFKIIIRCIYILIDSQHYK